MTPKEKRWQKPELRGFKNADEAIAYFTACGKMDHVEAVKRLFAEYQAKEEAKARVSRRVASSR